MAKHLLLVALMLFTYCGVYSQPPAARHLKHFSINDKKLGTINFYVTERDIDKYKPILLYLDGSGESPMFTFKIDAADRHSTIMFSTIVFNYDSLAAKYHVVFISKPEVKFADTFFVRSFDTVIETTAPPGYTNKLSSEWRAGAASSVIDFLCGRLKVNTKKVVVMGYSEGAQVAPHVAAINKKVTHVICFCGNGLNQLYDFVLQERAKAAKKEISENDAQKNIDTLMAVFKDIYVHPDATDKFWNGHTYKRWASFCTVDPIDYMLQLNVPIYFAHGTADDNTQIVSSDYVALEFLKRRKTNLIYKTYPAYNHYFQQVSTDKAPEEHINEVLREMFVWLDKQ